MQVRGLNANVESINEWIRTWTLYCSSPAARVRSSDSVQQFREESTRRVEWVMQQLNLTRKQVKRRLKNYRQWIVNVQNGTVPFPEGVSVPLEQLKLLRDPMMQVRAAATSAMRAEAGSAHRNRSNYASRPRGNWDRYARR